MTVLRRFLFAMSLLAVAACGDEHSGGTQTLTDVDQSLRTDVIGNYANVVLAAYEDSLSGVIALDTAVDAFIADPTDSTLQAAKGAWLDVRDVYGRTEAFRFYDGPIDNADDGPEGQINAWPMDEFYLDYVDGQPDVGLINDPNFEITTDRLIDANEVGGEANISTGFHAIEFLLWGQDLSTDGPGARPVTDYTDHPNAARRGQVLGLLTDLLIEDIQFLVDAWADDGSQNYRTDWLALDDAEAVQRMLRGIGALSKGELAGERIVAAYENRSQEDEHSCFADNTHNDIIANAQSIQIVWTGDYAGSTGAGLDDLAAALDADLAARVTTNINASVTFAQSIPAPFDQWLVEGVADDTEGRKAIRDTFTSLQDQGDLLGEVGTLFGLTISLDV